MFSNKHLNTIAISVVVLTLIAGFVWRILWVERSFPALSYPTASPAVFSANPTSQIPYPEILRIGLDTAKAAFDTDRAVFVDARSASSYSEGHIPGALLMNDEDLSSFIEDLDLSTWIITYCT